MRRDLRKLAKFTYVITEGKNEYSIVGFYDKECRELHINIADAHEAETTLIYGCEIWSNKINTVQPYETLGTVLNVFGTSVDLSNPVELAYEWGGMLAHGQPRVFIRLEGYPQ